MTDQVNELLHHVGRVSRRPDGSYDMPEVARSFLTDYLTRYGFSLADLPTHKSLVDAIRYCNAHDFEARVNQPAPEPGLQFLWHRLRRIGQ
jgi:hypothetical protein